MTPLCIQLGHITPAHQEILHQVTQIVQRLPDGLTCHDVCHEVAQKLPALDHKRGYFGSIAAEHSWLEIPNTQVIIDPYPWASNGPAMIYTGGASNPWRALYRHERVPPFWRSNDEVSIAVRSAADREAKYAEYRQTISEGRTKHVCKDGKIVNWSRLLCSMCLLPHGDRTFVREADGKTLTITSEGSLPAGNWLETTTHDT